MIMSRI